MIPLGHGLFAGLLEGLVVGLVEEYVELSRGVEDQVKEIERELRLMHAYIKHVEALETLGEREKGLADEMTEVAQDATDAVDTFLLKTAQRRRHGIFRRHALFFSVIGDRYILNKRLRVVMSKIHDLLDNKKKYGVSSSTSQGRARPSQEGSISSTLSELRQKFMILSRGNFNLDRRTVKNVARVANECKHLLWLVKDMELVEQDERLKVWMNDIEDLILFGREVVGVFMAGREKQSKSECNFFAGVTPNLSFNKKIQLIQDKIQEALHRKWAYGIGDIKGKTAQSSTIPNLKLVRKQKRNHSGMLSHLGTFQIVCHSVLFSFIGPGIQSASPKQLEDEVESICRDSRLMHALVKDIETIEDPDGILNAWVEEVRNVAHDADTTIDTYIAKSEAVFSSIEAEFSVQKSINLIRKTINTLTQRRTSYGIQHHGQMQYPSLPVGHSTDADLPLYLWRCLLYFILFPAKFEIPARRLIALWVAEGLVKKEDEKPPEVVAQEHLTELVDRKIVQVTKRKDNGNVRTCQLSPDQRDLWLSRAKKDIFLPTSESSVSIGVIRHLADHLNVTDPSFKHIHDSSSPAEPCYRNVRSFLSFDTREGSKPGEDVGNFLYKSISNYCLQHLRVLDLEGVFRPKLPKEVGELILMRYLGLRWTHLEKLPSCISNLLYLQTLDLKHTYISTLPRSIWKMQKLRHLYLSGSKFVPRPSRGSIEDLQTLRGVFVDEKSPVRGGLDRLVNLRNLGLKCRFMSSQTVAASSQQDAVADWIFELKHLQSLRLTSHNEMRQPGKLNLRSLSTLNHLSSIDFLGRVMTPNVFFELPNSLTELTLSATKLTDEYDPMRKLDKLPNLKILRLFSESYTGKSMRCYPGGFPNLQILKIWDLKDLVDWTVLEGALPTLSTLEIRSCIGLKMLPDGLRHVTSLNGLKLTKMPEIFKARTSDDQGEDWYKIAHIHFVIKED